MGGRRRPAGRISRAKTDGLRPRGKVHLQVEQSREFVTRRSTISSEIVESAVLRRVVSPPWRQGSKGALRRRRCRARVLWACFQWLTGGMRQAGLAELAGRRVSGQRSERQLLVAGFSCLDPNLGTGARPCGDMGVYRYLSSVFESGRPDKLIAPPVWV
jgi:hypothetical protein